jgi:hypothetical protein
MDRRRWSFALVGVAAARFGDDVRFGLAGVAPIPWAELDGATPLPGTAYKTQILDALGHARASGRRGVARSIVSRVANPVTRCSLCSSRAARSDAEAATSSRARQRPATRRPLGEGCADATAQTHDDGSEPNEHLKLEADEDVPARLRDELRRLHGDARTRKRRRTRRPRSSRSRERGFFDDTFFHRDRPGLRDPGRRSDGKRQRGAGVQDARQGRRRRAYVHGVVAMAKSGAEPAGTAGSQFFVVTAATLRCRPSTRSSAR